MANLPKQQYFSLVEAAEYLGVGTLTIRRMISRGQLKGGRIGTKMIRVKREDLDAMVREIPTTGDGAA